MISIHMEESASELKLSKAYLVYEKTAYGSGASQTTRYISEHPVEHREGAKPRILPGGALSHKGLTLALEQLAKDQGINTMVWADDSTVASSQRANIWWSKAQTRWMHFNTHTLQQSLPAKNPPLVWINAEKGLLVFAIKENARPGPDTPLFHAPLYNVYEAGHVCQGSMAKPTGTDGKAWEEAFYSATFTHPNPFNRKLTSYKRGNDALWKHLMTAKNKPEFPMDVLLPVNKTLGEVIDELGK